MHISRPAVPAFRSLCGCVGWKVHPPNHGSSGRSLWVSTATLHLPQAVHAAHPARRASTTQSSGHMSCLADHPDEDAGSLAHRTFLTGLQVLVFGASAPACLAPHAGTRANPSLAWGSRCSLTLRPLPGSWTGRPSTWVAAPRLVLQTARWLGRWQEALGRSTWDQGAESVVYARPPARDQWPAIGGHLPLVAQRLMYYAGCQEEVRPASR
jgi:hypothetical protein